jgi:hypothetical protein
MSETAYNEGSGRISGNVWWSADTRYRAHGVLDETRRVVTVRDGGRTIRIQVGPRAVIITSSYPDESSTIVIPYRRSRDGE